MLGRERVRETLGFVLRSSAADETEAVLMVREEGLTRFSKNSIHENLAVKSLEVATRVAVGKRLGSMVTNRLDRHALESAVADTVSVARLQPEVPEFTGFPDPQPVEPVNAFDDAVATASPEWRARQVQLGCRIASAHGVLVAGALATEAWEIAVRNSRGVDCYHAGTRIRFTVVAVKDEGTGYGQRADWKADGLDVESCVRTVVGTAISSQNPRAVDPGVYEVVLEPYAVHDILLWLGHGASALAVEEGRSWMCDRMGKPVMDERISVWDDGRDPLGIPLPFDFEGVAKQRVPIVEEGVPVGPVYDTATAAKAHRPSTGHGLPRYRPELAGLGPLPLNLFMGAGDASTEQMARQVSRGLYVTRFWYTRVVDPRDCVVTGMTRDGVFWIEDGVFAFPVRNLRFTQNYVQLLRSVRKIGTGTHLVSSAFTTARAPALLASEFTFTGRTEF